MADTEVAVVVDTQAVVVVVVSVAFEAVVVEVQEYLTF